jgi:hypothetical protein
MSLLDSVYGLDAPEADVVPAKKKDHLLGSFFGSVAPPPVRCLPGPIPGPSVGVFPRSTTAFARRPVATICCRVPDGRLWHLTCNPSPLTLNTGANPGGDRLEVVGRFLLVEDLLSVHGHGEHAALAGLQPDAVEPLVELRE